MSDSEMKYNRRHTDVQPVDSITDEQKKGGSTPKQYALPNRAREIQDLIEYRDMNFAIGNIFKAAYRLGTKEGTSEEYDLNKIVFFANRELRRISASKISKA